MSKTCEEVRNEVLKRVKKLDERRAKRKKIIYSCVSVAMCLVIILVATMQNSWKHNSIDILESPTTIGNNNYNSSTIPNGTTSPQEILQQSQHTPEKNVLSIRPFNSSKNQNTDWDSFGEDEFEHIDVVLNGSIRYRQLPLDEYEQYGFSKELEQSNFGKYIGTVVEIFNDDVSIKVGSQEPTLKGGLAYYYDSKGTSSIIVKRNEYCSIFVFDQFIDDTAHSLKETYSLYGAFSSNDISYLTYTIRGMNGTKYQEIDKGKVTNREKINSFYKITISLTPYKTNDPIAVTPDWLIIAQEKFNKHPENYNREDITVTVHFKNGMILSDISYQPYLLTGYVELMEPLTPAQNIELRNAIKDD